MLEIVSPSFVRVSVFLPSVPWLMCAVYRRIARKLGVVTSLSSAISLSSLCVNSANILIHIADEIPLILSVATLYIYHLGVGVAFLRELGLCGISCRVLLLVISRHDENTLPVRSFCYVSDSKTGSLIDVRQLGDLVSAPSYRFSCLCLLGSRSSTSIVSSLCLSGTCGWVGFPLQRTSFVREFVAPGCF